MKGGWKYVGKCMDNEKMTWKMHMDGWKESESQDQRWKRVMNGMWKYGRYVRNCGMVGACPQCRVKVEEKKWMDG